MRRLGRHGCRLAALAGTLALAGCGSLSGGFLASPAGVIAATERHEFLIVSVILVFVWAPVFLLVPVIAWHYRISNSGTAFRPQWGFSWFLEVLIWLPPIGIVALLAFFLVHYTRALDPYRPLAAGPALEVQVVALDWKWLFLYPAQHVATVNQLFVPVGRPVHFDITSGTVMQSLLMPRLAGQIFAMDGMRTQLNFQAAHAGTYFGENTQYNGDGFAADKFTIHALPPGDFANWQKQAEADPKTLDAAGYHALSVQSVVKQPLLFGNFTPDLFGQVLAQKIPPGYLAQHHESQNHG